MMVFVFLSYFCASLVNFVYGSYYLIFNLFTRWLLYPISAILLEIPNMAAIYAIHWKSYRNPTPQAPPLPERRANKSNEIDSDMMSSQWSDSIQSGDQKVPGNRFSYDAKNTSVGFMQIYDAEERQFMTEFNLSSDLGSEPCLLETAPEKILEDGAPRFSNQV